MMMVLKFKELQQPLDKNMLDTEVSPCSILGFPVKEIK